MTTNLNRIMLASVIIITSATTVYAADSHLRALTTTAPASSGQLLPAPVRESWQEEEICRCPNGAFFHSPIYATPWLVQHPYSHFEPCCRVRRNDWLGMRITACAAFFCIPVAKRNS